jgi:hypothetical protein
VTVKKNGFYAKFGLPKYGDVVALRSFIDAKYKEKDKQFN